MIIPALAPSPIGGTDMGSETEGPLPPLAPPCKGGEIAYKTPPLYKSTRLEPRSRIGEIKYKTPTPPIPPLCKGGIGGVGWVG